jgi:S-adenosylmethionine:tRNA ribosyltransferase-isomerase
VTLVFDLSGAALDEAIKAQGAMPLPPYIASRRAPDDQDRTDYQTLFARDEGAVAAPTAGLHFTERLMQALDARGISSHFVTLHVGPGTFVPVRAADTESHVMHPSAAWSRPRQRSSEPGEGEGRKDRRRRHDFLAAFGERG